MTLLIQRFAHWLLKTTGYVPVSALETIVNLSEPVQTCCDRCGQNLQQHACPTVTIDGEIAVCVGCGSVLPRGTVRQHTGAWMCQSCKGKIATGL